MFAKVHLLEGRHIFSCMSVQNSICWNGDEYVKSGRPMLDGMRNAVQVKGVDISIGECRSFDMVGYLSPEKNCRKRRKN